MNCQKIRHYLSRYYRGELSNEEKKLVSEHIHTCQGCAREAQVYNTLNQAVHNLEELKPSPDFESKLENKIREFLYPERELRKKPHVTTLPSLKWALIPIAAITLFLLFKGEFYKPGLDSAREGISAVEKDTLPSENFSPQIDRRREIPVNLIKVMSESPEAVFVMDNLRYSDLQRLPDGKVINKKLSNYVMDAVKYRPVDDIRSNADYVLPAVSNVAIEQDRSY